MYVPSFAMEVELPYVLSSSLHLMSVDTQKRFLPFSWSTFLLTNKRIIDVVCARAVDKTSSENVHSPHDSFSF